MGALSILKLLIGVLNEENEARYDEDIFFNGEFFDQNVYRFTLLNIVYEMIL